MWSKTDILVLVFLSILNLCFSNVFGQDNSFYRKYNLGGMQGGLHLEATSDGGFIATGQHEGNGSAGSCDVYVYRVDECGNILWFKLYGTSGADGGRSIIQTQDGGFLVSGEWASSVGFGMRISPEGDLLWLKTFPSTDWVFYGEELNDGSLIFAGRNALNPVYIRTDANGDVIWSKRITSIGEMPLYVEQGTDDGIYFYSSYNVPGFAMVAGKLDIDGNIVWSKGFGNTWVDVDHSNWTGRGFFDPRDQTFLVTSPISNQGFGGEDIFLMKLNSNDGSIIWSKAIGTPGSDQSRDICMTDLGYGIIGNTNGSSFSVAQDPNMLFANMQERDILLVQTDINGEEIFSRTYGATGRDKGVGVKFNIDRTYTISAYTGSPFFGNGDGSMDPLFIKTDTLGVVGCQTGFPNINFMTVGVTSSNIGSISNFPISSSSQIPTVNNFVPNDQYQCQLCYTEPAFQPSDTLVCVGEPVQFYNTTSVGLTCFQEWTINNEIFPGNIDTITYVFDAPGTYNIELYSTCGGFEQTFDINIYVHEVVINQSITSNYNGFEVSCPEASDGSIEVLVSGGFFINTPDYISNWSSNLNSGLNQYNLPVGSYFVEVQDNIGCSDTLTIVLEAPPLLIAEANVLTNYNGYSVSCYEATDGLVEAISYGGAGNNSYSWIGNTIAPEDQNIVACGAGNIVLTITDQNGCSTTTETIINQPEPLELTLVPISNFNGFDISCPNASDGSVAFLAEGGVLPYIFSNSANLIPIGFEFNEIPEGNFSVVVMDANNCQTAEQIQLNAPPPIQINPQVTSDYNGSDISCFGASDGQAEIEPNGGVEPYWISWEDGSSSYTSGIGLPPGWTTVSLLDANNCYASDSIWLSEPAPLSLSALPITEYNGFEIPCFGYTSASLTFEGAGGTGPYTFLTNGVISSNSLSNLGAGTYFIEIIDVNNCSDSLSIHLNEPTPLSCEIEILSNYNGYNISCHNYTDGKAEILATGGVGEYEFEWSNLVTESLNTILSSGLSSAVVQDANGCTTDCDVYLTQPEPLSFSYFSTPDTCDRNVGQIEIYPQGGVPYFLTEWNLPSGQTEISSSLNYISEGTYKFYLSDLNSCGITDSLIIHEVPRAFININYYPNPACTETDVSLFAISDKELFSLTWYIEDKEYHGLQTTHEFYQPGLNEIRILSEDVHQCLIDTTFTIFLLPGSMIYVPNAFTPDNDGVNDYFQAIGEGLEYFHIKIFDRWGELVHESEDINEKWLGNFKGGDYYIIPGVYSYILEVSGPCHPTREYKGTITLLR